MQQNGSEIEIDSRPSDAIAIAVRAEAPIFAAERVIEESAIEFEGEESTKRRSSTSSASSSTTSLRTFSSQSKRTTATPKRAKYSESLATDTASAKPLKAAQEHRRVDAAGAAAQEGKAHPEQRQDHEALDAPWMVAEGDADADDRNRLAVGAGARRRGRGRSAPPRSGRERRRRRHSPRTAAARDESQPVGGGPALARAEERIQRGLDDDDADEDGQRQAEGLESRLRLPEFEQPPGGAPSAP